MEFSLPFPSEQLPFRRNILPVIVISILSWLLTGGFSPASSQTLNTLVNFNGTNGSQPQAGLVQGSDGNFYGTTFSGGPSNFDKTNGQNPYAGLVQGSDGNFYGTTAGGGSNSQGIVFKMTPSGTLTTLVNFNGTNGQNPYAGLVQGSDSNFYGTTNGGGTGTSVVCPSGCGTVFRMTLSGALTTLVNFNDTNGSSPLDRLVQGSDGNFYGTTNGGGSNSQGTVFKVTPSGTLTTLVNFNFTNGSSPSGLVQGSDGNFYGTTAGGGSNSQGTVFKVTPPGILTTLVNFNDTNGNFPHAELVQGSDGNFYGTSSQGGNSNTGTAFRMTPSGALTTLVNFNFTNGNFPYAELVQGSDGNFYGTTNGGGSLGSGTVFKLSLGLNYYPISPCRIVDTRNTASPNLPIGSPVTYKVNSGGPTFNYSSQGGSASGCDIPSTAKAIFFNFVAVSPSGSGHFQAWPYGSSIPTASVLNYANAPGLNIANGIALPVCDPSVATCTQDLNVQANQHTIQLVVDVVGYFK
jgi:uncharacterized repeat protein (TIGR03803 family)